VRVLGLSAFYHDSAAALVEDGRIVAATQEERFTRKKFDVEYPRLAIDYCLKASPHQSQGCRPRRFLRQAIHQVRARLLATYLTN
jgi:carbamoyltransferase